MSAQMRPDPTAPTPFGDEAVGRIREAIAVLDAIDQAELLVAAPKGAEAARRHQCGVSLLAVLRRDLEAVAADLQAASLVQDVMSRVRNSGSGD